MAETERCVCCVEGWFYDEHGRKWRCEWCHGFARVAAGTFTQQQRELHAEIDRLEALAVGEPGGEVDR